jgi:hypothetical protein
MNLDLAAAAVAAEEDFGVGICDVVAFVARRNPMLVDSK